MCTDEATIATQVFLMMRSSQIFQICHITIPQMSTRRGSCNLSCQLSPRCSKRDTSVNREAIGEYAEYVTRLFFQRKAVGSEPLWEWQVFNLSAEILQYLVLVLHTQINVPCGPLRAWSLLARHHNYNYFNGVRRTLPLSFRPSLWVRKSCPKKPVTGEKRQVMGRTPEASHH